MPHVRFDKPLGGEDIDTMYRILKARGLGDHFIQLFYTEPEQLHEIFLEADIE